MSEYYAVQRSDEYLKHYGIKGMRWGVRKARESGNQKALGKQYLKAQKKLDKLTKKADVEFQNKKAKQHAAKAAIAAGVGAGGIASLVRQRSNGITITTGSSDTKNRPRSRQKKVVENGKGVYLTGTYGRNKKPLGNTAVQNTVSGDVYHPSMLGKVANMASARRAKELSEALAQKIMSSSRSKQPALAQKIMSSSRSKQAAIGASVLGLGTAAYQAGKYAASKYRTTKKGHAKAAVKRDAWRSEMNKAFAGTKYAAGNARRRKNR